VVRLVVLVLAPILLRVAVVVFAPDSFEFGCLMTSFQDVLKHDVSFLLCCITVSKIGLGVTVFLSFNWLSFCVA